MKMPLGDEPNKLPEGKVLNAEITSIKEVEKPFPDKFTGENAIRIAFEFTFLDDDISGRKHWEDLFPSFYPSPKCTMYQWTLKLLNRESLPEGFVLDTEAFEGMKVPTVLSTRHFTRRNGEPGSALEIDILTESEAAGMRASGSGSETESAGAPASSEEAIKPLGADDEVEPF